MKNFKQQYNTNESYFQYGFHLIIFPFCTLILYSGMFMLHGN